MKKLFRDAVWAAALAAMIFIAVVAFGVFIFLAGRAIMFIVSFL